jgi:probable F420-dependent oxidoreductase
VARLRFWLHGGTVALRRLPGLAVTAEECGYHGLALSDHAVWPQAIGSPYPYGRLPGPDTEYPDPWVTIAALAATTSRLAFVTKVYLVAARHPLTVARLVSTAATLSGNRVALGVGHGWMGEEFSLMGVDPATRGARLDETIVVLRKLWSKGWVEHHGTHFDFPALRLSPVPEAPVPIYAGGESAAALRRAARLDGWLGAAYPFDRLTEVLAELSRQRVIAGTADRPGYEVMAGLPFLPGLDDCRRLQELGVTSVSVAPWMDPRRPVRDGCDAVRAFADGVIARF